VGIVLALWDAIAFPTPISAKGEPDSTAIAAASQTANPDPSVFVR
jgi:hypothetical protein